MAGIQSKQQHVLETVKNRIKSGDFLPGDRIPSDSELVREFGFSRPTVAKALRELERRGLVERRPGSGTYVLEVGGNGRHFGLLIPSLGETEIFEPICNEMARMAQRVGHSLLLGANSSQRQSADQSKEQLAIELCQRYIQDRVAGVFFAPLELTPNKDAVNREIVNSLTQAGIPLVLLDRDYYPYPDRSNYDLVGIDNRRVGYMITHHLFERGCRRVIFVTQSGSASTIDARIAGFVEAVVKDAGNFASSLVHQCDPRDEDVIRKIMTTQSPDGILCGNDVTAGILMHTLSNLGVKIPDDVLVAGIDDVKYAELLRVPLTSMRQPCEAIGNAAFRAMMERIESPESPARDVLLGCELIVRKSTTRKGKATK
jgi:GntR family transcriptional regulator of arabinose operon